MTDFTTTLLTLHGPTGAARIIGRMLDPDGIMGPAVLGDPMLATLRADLQEVQCLSES